MNQWITLGNCRFEILKQRDCFTGLGKIYIDNVQVRSGRLPLLPFTQTFPAGLEFENLHLESIKQDEHEVRIHLAVTFRQPLTSLLRDHSFDPIHNLNDWNECKCDVGGVLEVVLHPSRDEFNGVEFNGFDYHYEYSGAVPLYFILDKASWELGGDITGATEYSQSSCSSPVVTFSEDTHWSTEGTIFFGDDAARQNPVMTHNLPRWASHGSFDFQFKDNQTLIGIFERVDLIRSVLQREPHKPELKTFDKFIFDQSHQFSTVPKKILLNTDAKSTIDQQNLWTWIFDEVHERARAEFGLREEPMTPRLAQNYWLNFSTERYEEDLIPAAANIGVRAIFVDNLNESDLTAFGGNMCGGHEYRLGEMLSGVEGVQKMMALCREHNIEVYSWTNNAQSHDSPIFKDSEKRGWFVKMEDARLAYGGAYSNGLSILDFKQDEPRKYWTESLKAIKAESTLCGYLFDSFYNLGFMPVSFDGMRPSTQWRELLETFKELQDAGVHFLIESLGPFGQVQHGCPKSYNVKNLFACYKIGLGNDYTTVPTGASAEPQLEDAAQLFRILAHMANPQLPLFLGNKRIDELWTAEHAQALTDFHNNREFMFRRYLQEDGKGVLWHDATGTRATLWNFEEREAALPGKVRDVTHGCDLPDSQSYLIKANHVYVVEGTVPSIGTASTSAVMKREASVAQEPVQFNEAAEKKLEV